MDHFLHAGYRPHPAGLLLLHRAAAGGRGASGEEPDAAAGEQDQAAAKPAAGKDRSTMMDESLATMGARKKKRHYRLRAQQRSQSFSVQFTDISDGVFSQPLSAVTSF